MARRLNSSVRSRSVVMRTGLAISRPCLGMRLNQPDAAVRHVPVVEDLDAAFFSEQQQVLEHVPPVGPDQYEPRQPAQQHPGRLTRTRLDQVLTWQAELSLDPGHDLTSGEGDRPAGGVFGRPA